MIYVSGVVCEGSSESRLRKAFEKEKHKKENRTKLHIVIILLENYI